MADPKIEVYSTPTCPYCQKTKEHLKENKHTYKEYNVAKDEARAHKMVELSGQMGVPVTVIAKGAEDGKDAVIVGYDPNAIDAAIKRAQGSTAKKPAKKAA